MRTALRCRPMSRLGARLLKLEDRLGRGTLCPVAVVSAPFPREDLDGWAARLLADLGWADRSCAVTVIDGRGPEVLLPPTRLADLSGDAERLWLGASDKRHAWLVCEGGNILSLEFEDADDRLTWCAALEREMAAAGGPDQWVRGG